MNILEILEQKVSKLPNGTHDLGLKAVQIHIQTAIRHLERGQSDNEQALFTDSIYRCNQAFEGSIKEAYRVLTGKDPSHETPADIEKYLTDNHVFRERVLKQFTNYRREWRNKSTHDYMLDFDESEALLAILAVSSFAIVLVDQITIKLFALMEEENAKSKAHRVQQTIPFRNDVVERVHSFLHQYREVDNSEPGASAMHLEGGLAGWLAASFADDDDVAVVMNYISDGREADIAVIRGNDRIAIETKRIPKPQMSRVISGVSYLSGLLNRGFNGGILVGFNPMSQDFVTEAVKLEDGNEIISILSADIRAALPAFFYHE